MTMRVRDMADLEREVLEEMKDDYVGLWEIARLVGTELGTEDEPTIRENTLHIVENMMMYGLIRPGIAKDDGEFEPWKGGIVKCCGSDSLVTRRSSPRLLRSTLHSRISLQP